MKKVDIKLKHWDYTCGDGCCSDSGIDVFVDGVEVTAYGNHTHVLIESILNQLGYSVSIEWIDEGDENGN